MTESAAPPPGPLGHGFGRIEPQWSAKCASRSAAGRIPRFFLPHCREASRLELAVARRARGLVRPVRARLSEPPVHVRPESDVVPNRRPAEAPCVLLCPSPPVADALEPVVARRLQEVCAAFGRHEELRDLGWVSDLEAALAARSPPAAVERVAALPESGTGPVAVLVPVVVAEEEAVPALKFGVVPAGTAGPRVVGEVSGASG